MSCVSPDSTSWAWQHTPPVWGDVLLSTADIQKKESRCSILVAPFNRWLHMGYEQCDMEVFYNRQDVDRNMSLGRVFVWLSNTQRWCSGRDTENRVREAAHYAELELWLPLTLGWGHTTLHSLCPITGHTQLSSTALLQLRSIIVSNSKYHPWLPPDLWLMSLAGPRRGATAVRPPGHCAD